MPTPVNIVCAECGYVFHTSVSFFEESSTPDECPRCASLRNKFGDTDVEHLAFAIYDCYHGHDYGCGGDWEAYGDHEDGVVGEFRKAARKAAKVIAKAGFGLK